MLFIPNVYANKNFFRKKRYKIMYKGSNCDQKSQLSEILTEPLNPLVLGLFLEGGGRQTSPQSINRIRPPPRLYRVKITSVYARLWG